MAEWVAGWLDKASWRSRFARVQRPELEQAVLRVVLVGLVYLYVLWTVNRDGHINRHDAEFILVGAGFVLLGLALLLHVLLAGGSSAIRRVIGMVADNGATTYCLIQMDEGGAFVLGVYLFVAFGNGFRFGRRALHISQAMSLVGFGLVLLLSPFWSQHRMVGAGFLMAILVLPFYVGVLTQRIQEAKKRADEANQAKGRFLANMSHEMRTPLNGVIALADVLRETNLSESQREIVETMTTSAHLLLAQIEDVLDMSKIEAGRIGIEKRPYDLGKLITSTVKVMLPQARYKGLSVNTEIEPSANRWFDGDAHHTRQVLLNLLANAVKFTEKGEVSLTVRARPLAENGAVVRFEVKDTGIGIPSDKQATIFEPFAQADDSITRVYGGTGLGTTIARHLVNAMGGQIGLDSAVGFGSTFWFELPLQLAEPQGIDLTTELAPVRAGVAAQFAAGFPQANVHKLRGARILVAEDNPTNQRVAQLILESGGHVVTIVNNGEAALDALERGGFDLALFDLSMPVVSGIEALKLYRFSTRTPIPVLVLSANVTTEAIIECERAGASEFISKPLRASVLLDSIERHLEGEAAVRVAIPPTSRTEDRPPLTVVDSPPVDATVLADLGRLSPDPTFVERLIAGFQADTERLVGEITEALAQRRYERVKDSAHALRGGAASVGATHLAHLAGRLDKAPHETLRLKAAQWTEELVRVSDAALQALDAHLEERRRQKIGQSDPG